jgi:hypothetical protein
MIIIRYRNFIINGTDMSGKETSVTQGEADKLVRLGYAEIVSDAITISASPWSQETKQPKKRGKKRGSKNSNTASD